MKIGVYWMMILSEKKPKVRGETTEEMREGFPPMHITEHAHDGVLVLKISGSLNFYSRKTFQAVMRNAERGLVDHVMVDLSQVGFLDSVAIGLLVLSQARLGLRGVVLSLVGPQGSVKRVLDSANIPKVIPVYSTEEEAIGLSVSA